MTSKYPQKTTAIKQAGSVLPKTVNGKNEFKALLNKPLGTNPDWYELMNKKPLKKLPLAYVLRRGLGRLAPWDTPVRLAIDIADTIWPYHRKIPPAYWNGGECAGCPNRTAGYWSTTGVACCTSGCAVNPESGGSTIWTNATSAGPQIHGYQNEGRGIAPCSATQSKWRKVASWTRKAGAPVPTPMVDVNPVPLGAESPLEQPVTFPTSVPNAVPVKHGFTKAGPGEEPSENPEPDKVPDYDLPVFDAPVVLLDPPWKTGINPQVRTQTVSVGGPGQPPRITATRGNPTQSRPGPRKKQDKPNIVKTAGKLWVAINFFTESLDFLEVLWDALPDKCKRKMIREERWGRTAMFQADHYSKLEDVYNCLGEIDVAKAITGYINNQIEDYFYGKMSAPTKKLSQQLGIISGLDRAINQAQQWAMKSVDEEGNVEETAILDAFLPKVDFDPHTGDVTLTSLLGETKVNLGTKVF